MGRGFWVVAAVGLIAQFIFVYMLALAGEPQAVWAFCLFDALKECP